MRAAVYDVFMQTISAQDAGLIYHRLTLQRWLAGNRMKASVLWEAYSALKSALEYSRKKRRMR